MRWTGSGTKLVIGAAVLAAISLGASSHAVYSDRERARPSMDGVLCRPIAEIVGPEDVEVDDSAVYVSSSDRRNPGAQGDIWRISLSQGGAVSGVARKLPKSGRDSCSFRPHGIALGRFGVEPTPRLFVINHHAAADWRPDSGCLAGSARPEREAEFSTVEVFAVEDHGLRFLQRLGDAEHVPRPNDLVVGADGAVYVTNPATGLDGLLEALDGANHGSTVAVFRPSRLDGQRTVGEWTTFAKVGAYANGIALSADGSSVYVAGSADGKIWRVPTDCPECACALAVGPNGSGPDNLSWHPREPGVLLAAAHPDLRRFLQHSIDARVSAPSEVWAIEVSGRGRSRLVWRDDGSAFSAASVAAGLSGVDAFVVGQVFGRQVLRCGALAPMEVAR